MCCFKTNSFAFFSWSSKQAIAFFSASLNIWNGNREIGINCLAIKALSCCSAFAYNEKLEIKMLINLIEFYWLCHVHFIFYIHWKKSALKMHKLIRLGSWNCCSRQTNVNWINFCFCCCRFTWSHFDFIK